MDFARELTSIFIFAAMAIAWHTYQANDRPCVKYGTSMHRLRHEACGDKAENYVPSRTWVSNVHIRGLAPATRYYYRIVSGNSTISSFMSPRPAGDKTPFTAVSIPDLGVYGAEGFTIANNPSKRDEVPHIQPELNHTTIGNLARTIDDFDLMLHPGDLAYADNWNDRGQNWANPQQAYQAILEQFYQQMAPIASRKPWMVSPGNHEADCTEHAQYFYACPPGHLNFTDFMWRFENTMPAAFPSKSDNAEARKQAALAKALAKPPFWYSFEYGMVHFTMINSETDYPNSIDGPGTLLNSGPFGVPQQQLAWLQADLASVDRSKTPWLVVTSHRPWVSTGNAGFPILSTTFEKTLYEYGVDLVITGHVHNSQLHRPVFNGTADPAGWYTPKAPAYVVSGGPGNIEGLAKLGDKLNVTEFAYDEDFSYATYHFQSAHALEISFVRSSTGETLFSKTLRSHHHDDFVRQCAPSDAVCLLAKNSTGTPLLDAP